MRSFTTRTAEETVLLGTEVGRGLGGGEILALQAPLGAGKTVFAKGVAQGLGIREVVTSPTFTIVSEYEGPTRLVHVDLYRIDGADEFEQLAVTELLNSHTVALVEWPERAGEALPEEALFVQLSIEADGSRRITLPEGLGE